MNTVSFNTLTTEGLKAFLKDNNQPSFRLNQILEWIYVHNVDDFSAMTNLPKSLIEILTETFVITKPQLHDSQLSSDGTKKYVLKFSSYIKNDPAVFVECVAIPSSNTNKKKMTVCISCQSGCPMGCVFCATGKQGFSRNLYVGEIVQQVIFIQNELNTKVSNVVLMGQGEPFLNFDNVIDAINILNNEKFVGIGARKITVSTCGLIEGIIKFSKVPKQYGLAISLHSAIQTKRNELMPGVKNYSLQNLKETIIEYINSTNRRPTFEYLLIEGVNDSDEDLDALTNFCKDMLCHINIIKFNAVPGLNYKPSSKNTITKWINHLTNKGIEATLRASRGSDIDAACGQLLNNNL